MRKVIASIYVSLDGVMEDPQNWELWNDEHHKYAREQLFASDALLLGRVTYEAFAAVWPKMREPNDDFADRINAMPKYVASRTLDTEAWNATIIKGDVAVEVARLKAQPGGDLLVYGSAALVRYLMQHGLIDEYRLWLQPVVVGSGKRLFEGDLSQTAFKLVGTTTFSTGAIVLAYAPA